MKINSKVLLIIFLSCSMISCDSQSTNKEFSKEDILNDEDFKKLMFALHKSQILIISHSKQIGKVYDEYMAVNRLSSCDYKLFDKGIDAKIIEYYENQCLIFTQNKLLRKKYSEFFSDNFTELNSKFKKLNPEVIIGANDVLKTNK